MAFTNRHNIDLTMAVFLAHNDYDGVNEDASISVTTLLKPTKEIILASRFPQTEPTSDISLQIASSIGSAIHAGIERAWKDNPKETLKLLGQPAAVYDTLRINPEDNDDDYFNVFIEQRASREINGFTINGKYDFIIDGVVEDIKTTSTFSWMKRVNDEKYILQGSMYKWLNPEKVTEDYIKIHFVFTDWTKLDYIKNPKNYPPLRIMTRTFKCLSPTDTQNWVIAKLRQLHKHWQLPQEELPVCGPTELWQDSPVYKYYKSGNTNGRATAVCKTPQEADIKRRENGGMGVVLTVYGKPKACKWCTALHACTQGQNYVLSGEINLDD